MPIKNKHHILFHFHTWIQTHAFICIVFLLTLICTAQVNGELPLTCIPSNGEQILWFYKEVWFHRSLWGKDHKDLCCLTSVNVSFQWPLLSVIKYCIMLIVLQSQQSQREQSRRVSFFLTLWLRSMHEDVKFLSFSPRR